MQYVTTVFKTHKKGSLNETGYCVISEEGFIDGLILLLKVKGQYGGASFEWVGVGLCFCTWSKNSDLELE